MSQRLREVGIEREGEGGRGGGYIRRLRQDKCRNENVGSLAYSTYTPKDLCLPKWILDIRYCNTVIREMLRYLQALLPIRPDHQQWHTDSLVATSFTCVYLSHSAAHDSFSTYSLRDLCTMFSRCLHACGCGTQVSKTPLFEAITSLL